MVYELGMGAEGGGEPAFLAWPQDPRLAATVSPEGRARLEAAVERLARGAYAEARRVLEAHRPGLLALTEALLLQETLEGEEAEALLRSTCPAPTLVADTAPPRPVAA
jgi:ATP-dependent Zn protease